jgi:hypothetical protein
MSDAFTRPTTLAFGRSGPVVASRSRLVVGWQPLAMSRPCVLTTSLTLAASAYLIFGIFGLTAKQPLLSTDPLLVLRVHHITKQSNQEEIWIFTGINIIYEHGNAEQIEEKNGNRRSNVDWEMWWISNNIDCSKRRRVVRVLVGVGPSHTDSQYWASHDNTIQLLK